LIEQIKSLDVDIEEIQNFNVTTFGNILMVIDHCPTKFIVKIQKIMDNIIEQLLEFDIENAEKINQAKKIIN
jgi:hypothetical protein